MSKVVDGFTAAQLAGVKKVGSASDIPLACPQTLNQVSDCFAAIQFNSVNESLHNSVNVTSYTLISDGSRASIDVVDHRGDFEQKILPLQWAMDHVRLNHSM
jgi:hypothetical protein